MFGVLVSGCLGVRFAEGSFSVSVTASNALGNASRLIDRPVHVQRPPECLFLDREHYVVEVLVETTFSAHVRRGTDVSVFWSLQNAAGDFVRHEGE